MIKLATDEDFNNRILRGVLRRQPVLDIRRKQDAGIGRADDCQVPAWAASEGRVLLSHDASTMAGFAYERIVAGLPMPGLFEVRQEVPGRARELRADSYGHRAVAAVGRHA